MSRSEKTPPSESLPEDIPAGTLVTCFNAPPQGKPSVISGMVNHTFLKDGKRWARVLVAVGGMPEDPLGLVSWTEQLLVSSLKPCIPSQREFVVKELVRKAHEGQFHPQEKKLILETAQKAGDY